MKPVQIGAGVRIHADCTVGHKNIWDSCEFANKNRTSILDIMISVFQLTIGLNMSQVRLLLYFGRIQGSGRHRIRISFVAIIGSGIWNG